MRGPRRAYDCVVFDLGEVLIRWDPKLLYRRLLADEQAVEDFLTEIDFYAWNHQLDAGQTTWPEAVAELTARFPHHGELIAAYRERFLESLGGPVEGTVEIVRELHARGTRLVALTNWAADTFELARVEMPFLDLFDGVLVSGREGVAKPDPKVFELLVDRFALTAPRTVFVDDREANVRAAAEAGLVSRIFRDPQTLRRDLTELGLLALPD